MNNVKGNFSHLKEKERSELGEKLTKFYKHFSGYQYSKYTVFI